MVHKQTVGGLTSIHSAGDLDGVVAIHRRDVASDPHIEELMLPVAELTERLSVPTSERNIEYGVSSRFITTIMVRQVVEYATADDFYPRRKTLDELLKCLAPGATRELVRVYDEPP